MPLDAIARTYPVFGSIETTAEDGSPVWFSVLSIALRPASWSVGSMVVWTSSPPLRTVAMPY